MLVKVHHLWTISTKKKLRSINNWSLCPQIRTTVLRGKYSILSHINLRMAITLLTSRACVNKVTKSGWLSWIGELHSEKILTSNTFYVLQINHDLTIKGFYSCICGQSTFLIRVGKLI